MRNHLVTHLVTHKWQNQNIFFFLCSIQKITTFQTKTTNKVPFQKCKNGFLREQKSTKINVLECLITWYNFHLEFVPSVSTCGFNKDKPYIIAWCLFHQFLEMFLFWTLTYDFKTTSAKSIQNQAMWSTNFQGWWYLNNDTIVGIDLKYNCCTWQLFIEVTKSLCLLALCYASPTQQQLAIYKSFSSSSIIR